MDTRFETLFAGRSWTPIRGCPGRYGLAAGSVRESPEALAPGAVPQEFQVAGARDPVVVVPLTNGGLISYKRPDGTYLHTLNTADGFSRKLRDLKIVLRS